MTKISLDDLDINMRQICKLKTSLRKIGFSASEFNEILHTGEKFDTALNNKIIEKLRTELEEKCIGDGYILSKSIQLKDRSKIYFPHEALQLFYSMDIKYNYIICNPNPGTKLECNIVSKSKIGVIAKLSSELSPLIILVPNDCCQGGSIDKKIKENDKIEVEVIGKKFEQNDKKITVVAKM